MLERVGGSLGRERLPGELRLSRLSCVTLTLQASQGLFTNTRLTLNTLLAVTSISTFISYPIQLLHRLLS